MGIKDPDRFVQTPPMNEMGGGMGMPMEGMPPMGMPQEQPQMPM
jgi:hypothetical protein